ncbi:hypothetical protein OROGR_009467 [Orobanche gracilis]
MRFLAYEHGVSYGQRRFLTTDVGLSLVAYRSALLACGMVEDDERVKVNPRTCPYYLRRCKRVRPTHIESLPDKLLPDIFIRIPTDHLYDRARLVCRRWYCIIHSYDFVSTQIQHSTYGLLLSFRYFILFSCLSASLFLCTYHILVLSMVSIFVIFLVLSFVIDPLTTSLTNAKVFMVLMEDEPVVMMSLREQMTHEHDIFLKSLLENSSYIKLYSYTHLLNGFAIYAKGDEVLHMLRSEKKVRSVYEDVKMEKLTTHTPDFLGITTGAWPALGGSTVAGNGVVIGLIDTGINPFHPSFTMTKASPSLGRNVFSKYRGKCVVGDHFPELACHGRIIGAQYFARAAIAAGEYNYTRDYASPFDSDGHGSHTAATAAGNHNIPVITNNFNYGNASGMAPGARIAVYKAPDSFGGYMSDVVAAVDQAVEDGVDILSLSIGPSSVPSGSSAFLNVLELELLFATKAGVLVVQAIGNGGPTSSSITSFSPWITSVAACITDRKYNSSITLGNGLRVAGSGLARNCSLRIQIDVV